MPTRNLTTFVVPFRNSSSFLRECLESIRSQSDAIEIIGVDNLSKDSSAALAAELCDRVVQSDAPTISGVRNAGARIANGTYLAFIDSDCVLPPRWLETAISEVGKEGVVMVGSKTQLLPASPTWVQRAWKMHLDSTADNKVASWLPSRAIMLSKSAFDKAGGFDETLVTCEDVDLSYRLLKQGRIVSSLHLAVIHLGEPKTLWQFMKKESWRGIASLRTAFQNLGKPKELLSIAMPLYFGVILLTIFIALFSLPEKLWLSIGAAALFLTPIVIMSAATARKIQDPSAIVTLPIIYTAYILGRLGALFRWR